MGAEGKPKIDAKDDGGTPNEPHKPKVSSSMTGRPFWLFCSVFVFVFFKWKKRAAYAASAHCFPVVFSPHLMICFTFTIPNVFLALFLPPALFSLADVLVVGRGRARHLPHTHVKFILDTDSQHAQMCVGSFGLSWRRQSLRSPSQSHAASNMLTHAHKAHCTMLTSHFGLHMQLCNNRTVLSALFSPASLFCSTMPHPPTRASIASTTCPNPCLFFC